MAWTAAALLGWPAQAAAGSEPGGADPDVPALADETPGAVVAGSAARHPNAIDGDAPASFHAPPGAEVENARLAQVPQASASPHLAGQEAEGSTEKGPHASGDEAQAGRGAAASEVGASPAEGEAEAARPVPSPPGLLPPGSGWVPPVAGEPSRVAGPGEGVDPGYVAPAGRAPPPSPGAEARRPPAPAPDEEAPDAREAPSPGSGPSPASPVPSGSGTFSFRPPAKGGASIAQPFQPRLTYQYGWGSESDILYRRNPDLNGAVRDDTVIVKPQIHGFITYRPFDWLEGTLEVIAEWEIAAVQEAVVVLPSGDLQYAEPRGLSLFADNVYLTFKIPNDIQLTVGRRNWEDERHWLWDTAMDGVSASVKLGYFRVDAFAGREVLLGLDVLGPQKAKATRTTTGPSQPADHINTLMLILDYRGLDEVRMYGYAIVRDDRGGQEGRLVTLGANAYGVVGPKLAWWAQAAMLRGTDELAQRMEAFGFDFGGAYRFTDLPLYPGIGLGYALGSGDGNPDDGTNREYRQPGLQSNEARILGIPRFKVYGEALDPELSNLQVLTASVGIRPARTVTVDLVYHHYWLNKVAVEMRNAALTAQMNEAARTSKDAGNALDVVVGVRNIFDSRLGLDVRLGWFFPGAAFVIKEGTEENPSFRPAEQGFAMFAKVWW